MTASEKARLLNRLLCIHGAGAKTNVGYGRFADPDDHPENPSAT